MKTFSCTQCHQLVFFENVQCVRCGALLAYLPDLSTMSALKPADGADAKVFVAVPPSANAERYRLCRNGVEYQACNWVVPADGKADYCRACNLNEIVPALSDETTKSKWRRIEAAKRRLLYTLFELGLPVASKKEDPREGLAFRFEEDGKGAGQRVLTGHNEGVITLNVAEADDPFREKVRESMGEAYRTLLGHFRHEVGHYYWDRLIKSSDRLASFRDVFGDERPSYDEALRRHYESGPPADWQLSYVSAYASTHPWEDWAETWAHYLHMVDALDTARNFGLALRPPPADAPSSPAVPVMTRRLDFDDFDDLLRAWVPLTVALNSLNRAVGHADIYPFVLASPAVRKLRFVHDAIEGATRK